jgi:hypothetical protein
MKNTIIVAVLVAVTAANGVRAQPAPQPGPAAVTPPGQVAADTSSVDGEPGAETNAQPTQSAPTQNPVLPAKPPAPPQQERRPAVTGQWMYTTQYGWAWIPYDAAYTYEPTDSSAYPYQYVYRVDVGWAWLAAPWVWGWGPLPYFGYWGPWHFHWYRGPGYTHGPHIGGPHPGHPGFAHPGFHGGHGGRR